jgi:hypothetical protein
MNNDLWDKFVHTGSVTDYLAYKQNEDNTKAELTNANNNQGFNNKGTINRGE